MAKHEHPQAATKTSELGLPLRIRRAAPAWMELLLTISCVALILGLSACSGYTAASQNQPAPQGPQITTTSAPNGTVGTAYSTALAASGGTTPYSWAVTNGALPAGLSLAASSGTISGTPTTAGTASFAVQVTDAQSKSATQALSISVGSAATSPAISTSSLSGGTVGTAYSATLRASGGTTPYTWSISTGSLPAGLALNASSGAISGTPTTAGTSTFTAQVKDANNNTGTKQLSIAIAAAGPQPLSILTTALPQASTAGSYSTTLQASGGTAPYTWSLSSGQLPTGLTLAPSSGLISGLALSVGQSSFTVKVTDSAQATATKALSITVVVGVALDQYGGRTDIKCANATGWFHTEKINSHWWLCTPLGNAYYAQGVEVAPDSIQGTFDPASVNKRMEAWGFNMAANYDSLYDYPTFTDNAFPVDSNGIHSNPVKMPFMMNIRPGFYSMENNSCAGKLLTNPVKNMMYSHSPQYTGYVASGGVPDWYDPAIGTWLQRDLVASCEVWPIIAASPYENYMIGIASDDGDETNGLGAGPDFPTDPPGYNGYNLAMQVAATSPVQTASNGSYQNVYPDTLMHSKKAWHDYLTGKYSTISALNTAWGSNYTTFDSSGTCVGTQPISCTSSASADSVGTGNGSTKAFSFSLTHTTVSKFSLQILVAGTPVAGDTGTGSLYGPSASGTINYSTGALSVTFSTAPASGAAITATYIANGWGIGSGIMDEDDRASHQGWMGSDWTALSDANANTKADINAFYEQIAAFYFSTTRAQLKAVFPNLMYLGPDSLSTWGGPSAAPVLKAAGQYIDAFITSGGAAPFTQAEMDYIEQNYGDKPYFGSFYATADPDSSMSAYPNPNGSGWSGGFATQPARGLGYLATQTAQVRTAHTTAGNYPYIGMIWFDYVDFQQLNWGLTTPGDNAYDGHEAVTAAVACSLPIGTYACGGEAANYGDVITSVKAANALWLGIVP